MERLAGKNILITGASQGLGREMALRFAREGAGGLSLVARHGDQLSQVCDDARKLAPKTDIVAIEADVSNPRDIERIVATALAQFKGHLDVLVRSEERRVGKECRCRWARYACERRRVGKCA